MAKPVIFMRDGFWHVKPMPVKRRLDGVEKFRIHKAAEWCHRQNTKICDVLDAEWNKLRQFL